MSPDELRERARQKREAASEAVGDMRGLRFEEAVVYERAADEIERLRRKQEHLVSILNGISRQTAEVVRAHS